MLIPWWPLLLYPLVLMAIPLAIALGQVVRGGPVTVMSVGAVLGIGAFWLSLRNSYAPNPNGSAQAELWLIFSVLIGATLLVGAWALALAQAFRARQWLWVALLCLAVYITIAALVFSEASGFATCLLNPTAFCGPTNRSVASLILTATFLAPVALLVYALAAGVRRQPRALPDGLTVSQLPAGER